MTTNGERAPRIGEQFRNSAILLLQNLNYQELFSGREGIDFAAIPPPPNGPLQKPCFAPGGITAFEFTAETRVNVQRRCRTFTTRIQEYNSTISGNSRPLEGGVLIVDTKVDNSIINAMREEGVYVWDVRYLNFLTAKCRLWAEWTPEDRRIRSTRAFREEEYGEMITSFRVVNSMSGFNDVLVGVFNHEPTGIVSVSDALHFLDPIVRPIREFANREAVDTVLHLRLHVAGEIERGLLYEFNDLLTNFVDDFVKLQEDSCSVYNFSCAPWSVFLPSM